MKHRGLLVVALMVMMPAGLLLSQQRVQVPPPGPAASENDVIDYVISEMLAAWQIGDTNMLHSAYADDVTFVSGVYEPPIIGWAKFLPTYQRMRARFQTLQIERQNTYTVVRGSLAWTTYQCQFVGIMEGQATTWRGHTTLVLEKRGGKWLIVHNHTSVVPEAPAPPAAPPAKP